MRALGVRNVATAMCVESNAKSQITMPSLFAGCQCIEPRECGDDADADKRNHYLHRTATLFYGEAPRCPFMLYFAPYAQLHVL